MESKDRMTLLADTIEVIIGIVQTVKKGLDGIRRYGERQIIILLIFLF